MLTHALYFSSPVFLADKETFPLLLTSAGLLRTSSEGAVASGAADSGNPVKVAGVYNSALPTFANGQRAQLQTGTRGSLNVSLLPSDGATPISDANGLYVVPRPVIAGGMAKARIVTGTTGTIKASAGQLYAITAYNSNAAVRYLQLYNKASAPTLSTDTPVMTIPLLGASVRDITLNDHGSEFTTGIAWAYTTDDVAIPTTAGTSAELHFTAHFK